jgi:hypothetical protein
LALCAKKGKFWSIFFKRLAGFGMQSQAMPLEKFDAINLPHPTTFSIKSGQKASILSSKMKA